MSKLLEKKQAIVSQIEEGYNGSEGVVFLDLSGVTANQIVDVRKSLKTLDSKMVLYKSTLLKRACDQLSLDVSSDVFKGQTAVVFMGQEVPAIAKTIISFYRELDKSGIKGGILEGSVISQDELKALSKLPGKDILVGQFVAGINVPIYRFVSQVSAPMRGLVYVLQSISSKLGGETNE